MNSETTQKLVTLYLENSDKLGMAVKNTDEKTYHAALKVLKSRLTEDQYDDLLFDRISPAV